MNPPNKSKPGDPLTPRQREVFNWMVGYTEDHFYQPSYREVMDHFGFKGPNSVNGYIKAFQRKGLIGRSSEQQKGRGSSGMSRAIEFLHRTPIEEGGQP